MGVSEGWRRTFVVLSAVYWVVALFLLAIDRPNNAGDLVVITIVFAVIYGVIVGLVAGVLWIVAGFRKPKSADE